MKEKRAGYQFWLLLSVTIGYLVMFGTGFLFAAAPKVPTTKIGATHHTNSTGDFKLTEQGTGNTGSASGSLVGIAFFAEKLFLDRFSAGLKYGYGLERSFEMQVGTSSLEVLENATFWALEFRAYIKDNISTGLKPFLGVSYGNYTVTSVITVIPTTGSTSEEQTTATIPYTMLSAGVDYTFGFGGIRIEAGQSNGKRNDLESSSVYYATYNYSGSVVGISVYSFF